MSQPVVQSLDVELAWGGKLPSNGDFLWSTPRSDLRVRLEEWLQVGMYQGRSLHGDAWNHCLDRGAVWNFLIPARYIVKGSIVVGCIAPSRDRVGRRYPLVAVYAFPEKVLMQATAVLLELPLLMSQLGAQMHAGLQRVWPRDAMDSAIRSVFSAWRSELSLETLRALQPGQASDILDVLGTGWAAEGGDSELHTRTMSRSSSYPWPDVASIVQRPDCPSLWWTNGAAGAPLKAFSYESGLDGPLMTWLFGRANG